jgi:hypothetical protein
MKRKNEIVHTKTQRAQRKDVGHGKSREKRKDI